MHSSRMRTGHSLTISLGGVSAPGWVSAPGGLPRRSLCSRGRGVSQHALRQTPPALTESQTSVKTLPWPNFVAAGNYNMRLITSMEYLSLSVSSSCSLGAAPSGPWWWR